MSQPKRASKKEPDTAKSLGRMSLPYEVWEGDRCVAAFLTDTRAKWHANTQCEAGTEVRNLTDKSGGT